MYVPACESEEKLSDRGKKRKAFQGRLVIVDHTWVYHFVSESKIHQIQWKHNIPNPLKKARLIRTPKELNLLCFLRYRWCCSF